MSTTALSSISNLPKISYFCLHKYVNLIVKLVLENMNRNVRTCRFLDISLHRFGTKQFGKLLTKLT